MIQGGVTTNGGAHHYPFTMNAKAITDPLKDPFPIERDELRRLYEDEGLSLDDIGKRIGASRQRIARWMEFWGLERRDCITASTLKRRQRGDDRGPNWRGGRYWIESSKTWFVYAPKHPRAQRHNGAVVEHILLAEERIGRPMRDGEDVHHLDLDRRNNAPANLCVVTGAQHRILHHVLGVVGMRMLTMRKSEVPLVLDAIPREDWRALVKAAYVDRVAALSEVV